MALSQERLASKNRQRIDRLLRIVATLIILPTMISKFLASEVQVEIFTKIGLESWGRYGIGGLELLAIGLLLFRRTAWMGAVLAMSLMFGAISFHLTTLGVRVHEDGGKLFIFALMTLFACVGVLIMHRRELPFIGSFFKKQDQKKDAKKQNHIQEDVASEES